MISCKNYEKLWTTNINLSNLMFILSFEKNYLVHWAHTFASSSPFIQIICRAFVVFVPRSNRESLSLPFLSVSRTLIPLSYLKIAHAVSRSSHFVHAVLLRDLNERYLQIEFWWSSHRKILQKNFDVNKEKKVKNCLKKNRGNWKICKIHSERVFFVFFLFPEYPGAIFQE